MGIRFQNSKIHTSHVTH